MRAATVVQVLQDLFYVLLHVLFYLSSLLCRLRSALIVWRNIVHVMSDCRSEWITRTRWSPGLHWSDGFYRSPGLDRSNWKDWSDRIHWIHWCPGHPRYWRTTGRAGKCCRSVVFTFCTSLQDIIILRLTEECSGLITLFTPTLSQTGT